ncbi:MAG: flagellar hook-basal body complex protein [Gammaproteobacteria bacterium]
MAFRVAISGLKAASGELDVIGNNIANSNTSGFKKSRAEFADVFAVSSVGGSGNIPGSGVRVSAIRQQFTQGNIAFTDNNLDMAINGNGFFILDDGGTQIYSRSGAFGVDRNGYLSNADGQLLTAFGADASGNITGAAGSIQVNTANIAPQATSAMSVELNLDAAETYPAVGTFDPSNPNSYNHSTSTTIYDSLGNAHLAAMYYVKAGAPVATDAGAGGAFTQVNLGAGETYSLSVGGVSVFSETDGGAGTDTVTAAEIDAAISSNSAALTAAGISYTGTAAAGTLQFTKADGTNFDIVVTNDTAANGFANANYATGTNTVNNGTAAAPNTWQAHTYVDGVADSANPQTLTFTSGGALQTPAGGTLTTGAFAIPGASNITMTVDYSSSTQFGSPFSVYGLSQDGFTTGRLSGLDIDNEGIIFARFTNGQSSVQGQLAIADFANPQGLQPVGDTAWAETFSSGSVTIGAPGTASLGLIQSGSLEQSNVDLSEELVNMIIAQRSFQANAEVISTSDAVTQSIINLR